MRNLEDNGYGQFDWKCINCVNQPKRNSVPPTIEEYNSLLATIAGIRSVNDDLKAKFSSVKERCDELEAGASLSQPPQATRSNRQAFNELQEKYHTAMARIVTLESAARQHQADVAKIEQKRKELEDLKIEVSRTKTEIAKNKAILSNLGRSAKRPRTEEEAHESQLLMDMSNPPDETIIDLEEDKEAEEEHDGKTELDLIRSDIAKLANLVAGLVNKQNVAQSNNRQIVWGPPLPTPRQQSSQPNRARSANRAEVKKSAIKKSSTNASQKKNQVSYATALMQSNQKAETIRNIVADVESDEEAQEIMAKLVKDKQIVELGNLVSVKKNSGRQIRVVLKDAETANKIDAVLHAKFGEKVKSTQPTKRQHMIRITGLDIEEDEDDDFILENLKASNSLLQQEEFQIVRHYDIHGRRPYRNVIIAVEPIIQARIIADEQVFYGLSVKKAHEYVDDILCKRCWRHGHFKHSCTFSIACKRCGGNHEESDCIEEKYTCVNCKRRNAASKLNTSVRHRVTDDRCPVAVTRLEEIKKILSKN